MVALSPDLSTVTVQGTYVDLTGVPISGSIRFTPQTIIKDKDYNQIIINAAITKTFNGSGFFSAVLPNTDDSDVSPQPFAYYVEELFSGGRNFYITLPIGTSSPIDIADIAPSVEASVAALYITSNQYNTLLSSYNTANSNYQIIANIKDNADAATTSANNASYNLASIEAKLVSPFLLMGI